MKLQSEFVIFEQSLISEENNVNEMHQDSFAQSSMGMHCWVGAPLDKS